MTIRVQATTSTPLNNSGSAASDNGAPSDLFAALLGSQLSTAIAGLPGGAQGDKLGAALGDGKGTSREPSEDDPAKTTALDPAALLAMPVFVPPVVNPVAGKATPVPTTGTVASAATTVAAAETADVPANALLGKQTGVTEVLPTAGQAVAQAQLPTQNQPGVAAQGLTPQPAQASTTTGATPSGSNANKAMASKLETFQSALNDAAASSTNPMAPANAHALLADAAAQARPAGAPPVIVASSAQPLPLAISTHLADSNWSQALGHQMMTMVNLKSDQAQISLNPSHLGPIEVSLKIDQNQAQVVFNAATPQAREAVENSLPRLAAMLAGSGLQLADAQVSSGQSGDPRQAFGQQQRGGRRQDQGGADDTDVTLANIKAARGIVSTFA